MNEPRRAFDHVLIIMFENQYRSYMMENAYFRGLAAQGINMHNYFGVMHPSQTNYIASIAGELCNVTDDERPPLLKQRTIVDLIEESPYGLRWKAYMESYIPQNTLWKPGLVPQDQYPYVIKHNPFSSFANIVKSKHRWRCIVDESELWKDLLNGTLPEYAWLTPNMWNDGHYINGTQEEPPERAPALVDQMATWLEAFFGAMRFPGPNSYLPPRTLVVVTTDESDFEAAYDVGNKYTYDGPNQIYTVLLGDMIAPGGFEEGCYNHYSLLRTIEKNFGLSHLGKNDAQSNWFQFLWGKHFQWGTPSKTPIETQGDIALAEYQGALYLVYGDAEGKLCFRTFDSKGWSTEQKVGHNAKGRLALAKYGEDLILVSQAEGGSLYSQSYTLQTGWSQTQQPIPSGPVKNIALAGYDFYRRLMLVCQDSKNNLYSHVYARGKWTAEPTPVGQQTDAPFTLATLGPSLYLIYKSFGGNDLNALSYNSADFNVVTVKQSKYSGPYDSTIKDRWSLTAFPVARFSHARNKKAKNKVEPLTKVYEAGSPLVATTLEGVIHLAHPGVSNPLVLTEEFSVSGVMTAEKPVSYKKSDEKKTSNGYGTLAEAGWSAQKPVNGVYNHSGGAMAMAHLESEVILAFQPDTSGQIYICTGKMVTR
ncbi:MAG: alkaline phosphatase family protein [Pyrinomonadaceae bacterium]